MNQQQRKYLMKRLDKITEDAIRDLNQRFWGDKLSPKGKGSIFDDRPRHAGVEQDQWLLKQLQDGTLRMAKNAAEVKRFGGLTNIKVELEKHNKRKDAAREKAVAIVEKKKQDVKLAHTIALDVIYLDGDEEALEALQVFQRAVNNILK